MDHGKKKFKSNELKNKISPTTPKEIITFSKVILHLCKSDLFNEIMFLFLFSALSEDIRFTSSRIFKYNKERNKERNCFIKNNLQ